MIAIDRSAIVMSCFFVVVVTSGVLIPGKTGVVRAGAIFKKSVEHRIESDANDNAYPANDKVPTVFRTTSTISFSETLRPTMRFPNPVSGTRTSVEEHSNSAINNNVNTALLSIILVGIAVLVIIGLLILFERKRIKKTGIYLKIYSSNEERMPCKIKVGTYGTPASQLDVHYGLKKLEMRIIYTWFGPYLYIDFNDNWVFVKATKDYFDQHLHLEKSVRIPLRKLLRLKHILNDLVFHYRFILKDHDGFYHNISHDTVRVCKYIPVSMPLDESITISEPPSSPSLLSSTAIFSDENGCFHEESEDNSYLSYCEKNRPLLLQHMDGFFATSGESVQSFDLYHDRRTKQRKQKFIHTEQRETEEEREKTSDYSFDIPSGSDESFADT